MPDNLDYSWYRRQTQHRNLHHITDEMHSFLNPQERHTTHGQLLYNMHHALSNAANESSLGHLSELNLDELNFWIGSLQQHTTTDERIAIQIKAAIQRGQRAIQSVNELLALADDNK